MHLMIPEIADVLLGHLGQAHITFAARTAYTPRAALNAVPIIVIHRTAIDNAVAVPHRYDEVLRAGCLSVEEDIRSTV